MHWPFKNKLSSSKRVAVQLESKVARFMLADQGSIVASQTMACEQLSALPDLARQFVESNGLASTLTTVLMGLDSYQMLLVEAPPVAADELAEALKWKVKDLLPGSVAGSIVDGFLLPEDAYRGRQKMAYSVATDRVSLQQLADNLSEAGLVIDRVEIPELALLRMLDKQSLADQTEMVMALGDSAGFIMAIADKSIYLSRKLDISHDTIADTHSSVGEAAMDRLVLEMQRSRDYFESQMGKGVISRLLLTPSSKHSVELINVLNERLGLPVENAINDLSDLKAINAVADSAQDISDTEDFLLVAALYAA